MSDKPPIYREDGTLIVRASSAGASLKALVALIMGFEPVPPSRRLEEIFALGHELEPEIIEQAEDEVGPIQQVGNDGRQIEVELQVAENIIIRGHIDGAHEDYPVVEAKSFGESLFRQHSNGTLFEKNPYYATQLAIYMEARGKPALYLVGEKVDDDGEVTLGFVDAEVIHEPPADINAIKAKIIRAVDLASKGELPVECDCDGWMCPIPYLHEQTDEHTIDDDDLAIQIDALAATYVKARAEEKNAEAKKKEVGEKIAALLEEHDIEKGETDRFTVSQVSYNRKRLDKKALRKVVNLEEFEVEYPVSYPSITEKGIA